MEFYLRGQERVDRLALPTSLAIVGTTFVTIIVSLLMG
jgi:hypothetical protein